MGAGRAARAACAAALCALAAAPARADDVHYHDYPVGNRALGLGGAFCAIANDPSGAWYNPAGLVGMTRSNVSVSTSLFGVQADRPADVPGSALLRLGSVAAEVGAAYVSSEPEPGRNAPAAWGFDVLVPSNLDTTTQRRTALADGWEDHRREQSDRTMFAGVAGAVALPGRLSAGLSLFVLHRTQRLDERATTRWADGARFHEETTELSLGDDSLLAKAGLRWAGENWWFGLALESPNVPVRSKGRVRLTVADSDAGGAGPRLLERVVDSRDDPASLVARTRLGGALRAGAAWIHGRTATATCDLALQLPVEYARLELRDAPELPRALQVPARVRRRPVLDGACGGEWRFHKKMSVAGGVWTDFSSAPPLETDAAGTLLDGAQGVLPHVNLYGATAAFGWLGDHSLTRVGATFASGRGLGPRYDAPGARWVVEEVSQTFAFVFVASTFRY